MGARPIAPGVFGGRLPLIGDPTSSTSPATDLPATCWTVSRSKASPEIPKIDLAGANRGLS